MTEAEAAIKFCRALWDSDYQKSLEGERLVQSHFPPDIHKAFCDWIEAHDQEIYNKRLTEDPEWEG